MKRVHVICLVLFLATTSLFAQSSSQPNSPRLSQSVFSSPVVSAVTFQPVVSHAQPMAHAQILADYGKLPLAFEANRGQADSRVKFLSRTRAFSLLLTADEAVLTLRGRQATPDSRPTSRLKPDPTHPDQTLAGGVLRMKLHAANSAACLAGFDQLPGTSNYFIGNDPAKWRTGVPTYAKVKYQGIYPGVDLVYYGNQQQLEYDFIVAPGADPRTIAFDVSGARRIVRDQRGDLIFKIKNGGSEVRWRKPVVYQEKDGARQLVAAHYVVTAANRVGFEVAKHDAGRALYIDPLVYSSYLGGSGGDQLNAIAVDAAGNAYVTGSTNSVDFPTLGSLQAYGGYGDAFVTKINPSGTALVYSTYLGGSDYDAGTGIGIDVQGNVYISGVTGSPDFPLQNPLQPTYGGNEDAFVTEINSTGSALVYSTYLGGSGPDAALQLAVDRTGDAYVSGLTYSTDFPVTPGAYQTTYQAPGFATKISPGGSALAYSTYLTVDGTSAKAVDSSGNSYFTQGGAVSELNATGSALVYSAVLNSPNGLTSNGIAVDSTGNAYITGRWFCRGKQDKLCGHPYRNEGNAYVAKFNSTGSSLIYNELIGNVSGSEGYVVTVDGAGNAYFAGVAGESYPTTPGAVQRWCGGQGCSDVFLSELDPTGTQLLYSTYFGNGAPMAIALDVAGNAYIAGDTSSTHFPVTPGAFQTTCGGDCSPGTGFVAKFNLVPFTPTSMTLSSSPNPSTRGQAVTFTAVITSEVGPPPDGEVVTFLKGKALIGTATLSGGSASLTTSTLKLHSTRVKAVYAGDSKFSGTIAKVTQEVVKP